MMQLAVNVFLMCSQHLVCQQIVQLGNELQRYQRNQPSAGFSPAFKKHLFLFPLNGDLRLQVGPPQQCLHAVLNTCPRQQCMFFHHQNGAKWQKLIMLHLLHASSSVTFKKALKIQGIFITPMYGENYRGVGPSGNKGNPQTSWSKKLVGRFSTPPLPGPYTCPCAGF